MGQGLTFQMLLNDWGGKKRKLALAVMYPGLRAIEIMWTVAAGAKAGITELWVVMSSSGLGWLCHDSGVSAPTGDQEPWGSCTGGGFRTNLNCQCSWKLLLLMSIIEEELLLLLNITALKWSRLDLYPITTCFLWPLFPRLIPLNIFAFLFLFFCDLQSYFCMCLYCLR